MEIAEAVRFLSENHRAVLHVARRDGGPALSPVTVGVDDEGRVCISTRETAVKVAHARRTGTAAVCAFTDAFFGPWVQVSGPVEVVSLPEAMDLLVDYYRRISGEHPDWDDYRAAMLREHRCILRITPERVGPTVSG
ncbi:PPOX class probable F420-dependent enzyme [Kineococcus xinjiangensis]|uniref:PPOX class probable F420-dependent enzyme n=1 Tax=Kineococcus xinjiangensis TaxID=512762 RepID=A0A2S6ITT0_9ACTN|nr:PPOX class F420-dependent oxidoreductase [Kineococcus xinjiangensis]PPK97653.1 PPOX class probable F420-dependent enzyme [Kineococcus xinjiangensis]